MFFDLMLCGILTGIGIAIVAGILGCFLVWQKMAYFGDTISHSALLGVAFGIYLSLPIPLAVFLVCGFLSLALVFLQKNKQVANDTWLGIIAHSSLGLGLLLVTFVRDSRTDLMSYLFGDILTVNWTDTVYVYLLAILVLTLVTIYWRNLLSVAVDASIAAVEGVNVFITQMLLFLMLTLTVVMAMKIVGVLLITSLLIIPAAVARFFAKTPKQMALLAAIAGSMAIVAGLMFSLLADVPSGPAIVVSEAVFFIFGSCISCFFKQN